MNAIRKGVFAPGSQLPNTREISRQLHVSLLTAHRALQDLTQQGWLARSRGQGTIVRPDLAGRKPRLRLCVAIKRDEGDDPCASDLVSAFRTAAGQVSPGIETEVRVCDGLKDLDLVKARGVIYLQPIADDDNGPLTTDH